MTQKALLGFSIGQEYSKGEALKQDLELAAKRYDEITILCADTLQRKTKMLLHKLPENDALKLALADGDEWLKELTPHLKQLDDIKLPYKVIRWDEILATQAYQDARVTIDDLFNKNKIFNRAVKRSAGKFLSRYQDKIVFSEEEKQGVINACIDYVLEESAAVYALRKHTHLQYHHKLNEAVAFVCKQNDIEEVVAVNETKKRAPLAPHISFFKATASSSPPHRDIEQLVLEIHLGTIMTQLDMIQRRNDVKPEAKRAAYKKLDKYIKDMLAAPDEMLPTNNEVSLSRII